MTSRLATRRDGFRFSHGRKSAAFAFLAASSSAAAWTTTSIPSTHRRSTTRSSGGASSSSTSLHAGYDSLLSKLEPTILNPVVVPIEKTSAKLAEEGQALSRLESNLAQWENSAVKSGAKSTINALNPINAKIDEASAKVTSVLTPDVAELKSAWSTALEIIQAKEGAIDAALSASDTFHPAWSSIKALAEPLLHHPTIPPSVVLLLASVATYTVFSTVLSFGAEPPPNKPYPLNRYDATAARRYYDNRPFMVVARAVEVALLSSKFLLGIASDYLNKKLDDPEQQSLRAKELTVLLTELGPSFVKIGQSLSIRTDLLSPAYVRGLRALQDDVKAYPTSQARVIIESELGRPIDELFEEFSAEPVASASLGQVYKAKLRGSGKEVAIKVQRPDIMDRIALDMHLLREIAPLAKRTFNLNTDTVGTVDAWGTGFVDELDYIAEAVNAKQFTESIQTTPLAGVVFSPPVVDECTTDKVLTTDWVIGERLDKSSKDDVTVLCSIAMNTYLTMMLETGVLHCDPHPGNLLRTTDGRLCILDWGMVTRLDPDLQVTLIEHMAHLTSADYEEVPRDLLLLGFIPESKADLIRDSGIVEVLADIYGAWTKGGGAAAVNVNKVVADLQDLTAEKGNLFQIPPYFAYIAKSFSVLEGIGLSNDSKYSIINECMPYISKRLLTDKSDRTGGALSTFIFGPEKSNEDRIVDYDRVEQLVTGFGSYTTSASGALLGADMSRNKVIEQAADQILDLLVTEEETPLQTIFIEQLAKIVSSSSRSIWSELRERSGKLPSGRTVLGSVVDPLGLFRTSPVVRMNELDQRTIDTTRNLVALAEEQLQASDNDMLDVSTMTNEEVLELSSMLVRKVWERRRGVVQTSNRLAQKLLQLTADKLERGEREILVLPSSSSPPESDGRIHDTSRKRQKTTSERLEGARKLLEDLERRGDEVAEVETSTAA